VTSLSLAEVAEVVDGRLMGAEAVRIRGVAPVRDANPDQLGLLTDRRYLRWAVDSRAAAFLATEALADDIGGERPRVVVRDGRAALRTLLEALHPEPDAPTGVHPTAVLGSGVRLGQRVFLGPYAVVGDGAVLGDDVRVGAHSVIGPESRIGEGSRIHPHVVLYHGTVLGRRVLVHAGARIGSEGFGFALEDAAYRKIPQVGRVVVEDDVEVGANVCIDRGSIGDTVVGRGSKLDNLVHLAHNVRVGEGTAFAAQVGIAGSTRIGRGAVFGGQAGTVGHLEIGDGAQIAAQAGVIGDVGEGEAVTGYPARPLRPYLKGAALMLRLPEFVAELRSLRERLDRLAERVAAGTGSRAGQERDPEASE